MKLIVLPVGEAMPSDLATTVLAAAPTLSLVLKPAPSQLVELRGIVRAIGASEGNMKYFRDKRKDNVLANLKVIFPDHDEEGLKELVVVMFNKFGSSKGMIAAVVATLADQARYGNE